MFDNDFEPRVFDDYAGQDEAKETLQIYVESSKCTDKAVPHVALLGASGTGKTALSKIVANELGVKYHKIWAPSVEDFKDIVNILKLIELGDILFIDEAHRLPKKVQYNLYEALTNSKFTYVVGSGKNKEYLEHTMPDFTCIIATTHEYKLQEAFLRRFNIKVNMTDYSVTQLFEMAQKANQRIYDTELPEDVAKKMAVLSHGSAGVLYNFIKKYNTFLEVMSDVEPIKIFQKVVKLEKLDWKLGLGINERKYLTILARNPTAPTAVDRIATIARVEVETIKDIVEPRLLKQYSFAAGKLSLIEVQARGRKITKAGLFYLDHCKKTKEELGWFASEEFE